MSNCNPCLFKYSMNLILHLSKKTSLLNFFNMINSTLLRVSEEPRYLLSNYLTTSITHNNKYFHLQSKERETYGLCLSFFFQFDRFNHLSKYYDVRLSSNLISLWWTLIASLFYNTYNFIWILLLSEYVNLVFIFIYF